ncbi:MAG: hypothetical protein IKX86_01835 [Clostridia bacterium]|nr:hypothetical protein [Clostridia bacterium]
MKIISLRVGSFAGMSGTEVPFGDGLNIIESGNETGKSTVADFVRFLFYGFERGERELYTPFSGSSCSGSAVIEKSGDIYTVERFEDGTAKRVSIFKNGIKVDTGLCPGEFFTGIPDGRLFSSVLTASDPKPSGGGVVTAVQNILTGGSERISAEQAGKALGKLHTDLRAKRGDGGRLNELDAKAKKLRRELDEIKERELRAAELSTQKTALERRIGEISAEESRLKQDRITYLIGKLREKAADLDKKRRETDEANRRHDEFENSWLVRGRFPNPGDVEFIKETVSRGAEAEAAAEAARSEYEQKKEFAAQAEEVCRLARSEAEPEIRSGIKKQNLLSVAAYAALGLFTATLALTLVAFFAGMPTAPRIVFPVASAACLTAFILLILGVNRVRRKIDRLRDFSEYDEAKKQTAELCAAALEKKNAFEAAAQRTRTEVNERLKIYRLTSSDPVGELEEIIGEHERLGAEYAALNSAYTEEKIRFDTLLQSESTPTDDGRDIILPEGYGETTYTEGMEALAAETVRLNRELLGVREEIARLEGYDSAEKAVELRQTEDEISRLGETFDAVLLAEKALAQAADEIRMSVAPSIKRIASEKMSVLTSGKYASLGVDGSLAVTFTPGDGAGGKVIRDERYMSTGTADCSYISLRLAMAELISGSEPLPMIFDETLNHLDGRRMLACLEMLSARGGQVLLFTASDRERRISEAAGLPHNMITLGNAS